MFISVVTRYADYQLLVDARRISPPLMGRWHFAGELRRVIQLGRQGPGAEIAIPSIGDVYGETEAEAERKAAAEVKAWLLERDGGPA